MKKTIRFIFIICFIITTLIGCDKEEITLDPIAESAIAEYLQGKDPVLDNSFTGTYTIVSRTCDKKTDDLIVSYNGSSSLFDYQAKYQVKSIATEEGWVIESFEIVDSSHVMKEITPSMLKELLDGVDKNVTSSMSGTYSLVSKEVEDNLVKFIVKFVSSDGKYTAQYDGEAVVTNGNLELQKVVINVISDGDSSGESGENSNGESGESSNGESGESSNGESSEGETTLSKNYDPNKKAADYGYTAPAKQKFNSTEQNVAYFIEDIKPGKIVTKVEYLGTGLYEQYKVTYEERYKYVKDVYVQYYELYWDGSSYNIFNNEMVDSSRNSNFEGVYVNKANGSYIIMHENWKFELHEFYLAGGTIKEALLKEYYRISNTSMKWQNRKYAFKSVWTDGKEPDVFAVTILSINELRLDTDILSSKSGDVFVKVAE
ncbi:MAG: hypothetical protein ACOX1E_02375 [Erysipelotrichaceae bacterium]